MGVTNFDNLPQNIVQTALKRDLQTLNEQKGSLQRTTGNNIRYYLADNDGEFAWQGRTPTSGAIFPGYVWSRLLRITVVAGVVIVPLTAVAVDVYTSSDGASWTKLPYTYMPIFSDPNDPLITSFLTERKGISFVDKISQWELRLGAKSGVWLAIKVQVAANDKVSMSLEVTTGWQ